MQIQYTTKTIIGNTFGFSQILVIHNCKLSGVCQSMQDLTRSQEGVQFDLQAMQQAWRDFVPAGYAK